MELRDGYTPADLLRHTYTSQCELDALRHSMCKEDKNKWNNFVGSNEGKKEGGDGVYRWVRRVSLFKIRSCSGTAGCHLCTIFHPWHSGACGGSICTVGTYDWQTGRGNIAPWSISQPPPLNTRGVVSPVTYEVAVASAGWVAAKHKLNWVEEKWDLFCLTCLFG